MNKLLLLVCVLILSFISCENDDESDSSSNSSTYQAPNERQKELNKTFPLNDYRKEAGENMITIMADRIGNEGAIEGRFYFVNDRKNQNGKFYEKDLTYYAANFNGKLLYVYNYNGELELVVELKYSTSCKDCNKTPYLMLHETTPQKDKLPYLMDLNIGIWY